MFSKKQTLHFILLSGCLTGYIWLFLNVSTPSLQINDVSICILKHNTGIPCPSCGATRSVLAILQGNFFQALQWNPLGFLLVLGLFTLPAWILFDTLTGKTSLLHFYTKVEVGFKQKKIAIPAIALILLNWYW